MAWLRWWPTNTSGWLWWDSGWWSFNNRPRRSFSLPSISLPRMQRNRKTMILSGTLLTLLCMLYCRNKNSSWLPVSPDAIRKELPNWDWFREGLTDDEIHHYYALAEELVAQWYDYDKGDSKNEVQAAVSKAKKYLEKEWVENGWENMQEFQATVGWVANAQGAHFDLGDDKHLWNLDGAFWTSTLKMVMKAVEDSHDTNWKENTTEWWDGADGNTTGGNWSIDVDDYKKFKEQTTNLAKLDRDEIAIVPIWSLQWPFPNADEVGETKKPWVGKFIVSVFGHRQSTNSNHRWWDIRAPIGTPFAAAADGEVVVSWWQDVTVGGMTIRGEDLAQYQNTSIGKWIAEKLAEGYGQYIIVKHDGDVYTLYGHLDSRKVKVGDRVKAWEIIGTTGNTWWPMFTGIAPHLHYETRKWWKAKENAVSPAEYYEVTDSPSSGSSTRNTILALLTALWLWGAWGYARWKKKKKDEENNGWGEF